MLAGYGNYPAPEQLKPPGPDIVQFDMADVERFVSGCAMNFPIHSEALGRLEKEAA
jgi:tryptophan 6-halogenase